MRNSINPKPLVFIEGQDAVIATRDYIADRLRYPEKYAPKTVTVRDLPLSTRLQIRDMWDEWWQTERQRFVGADEERETIRRELVDKWAEYWPFTKLW